MFTVGLRVSEVLGLAWSDIDLDAGTAHVRRAVVDGDRRSYARPDEDRRSHRGTPSRPRHRRAAASMADTTSRGAPRRRAAVADPHLRVAVARSGVHQARRRARRPPTNRQAAAARRARRSASTPPASAPTSAAAPSSPRSTPPGPTSVTSPATSATPARPPPPGYVASLGERPQKTAQRAAELLDTPMQGQRGQPTNEEIGGPRPPTPPRTRPAG